MQSDAVPDEKQTAILKTPLEQIEPKKITVKDYDAKISEGIKDTDVLENEILDAKDIRYNIVEKITLIKTALSRSRLLNTQAPPYQPQHVHIQPQPDFIVFSFMGTIP